MELPVRRYVFLNHWFIFPKLNKQKAMSDALFQLRQLGFWFAVFGLQWVFLIHVLMPAVDKLDFSGESKN